MTDSACKLLMLIYAVQYSKLSTVSRRHYTGCPFDDISNTLLSTLYSMCSEKPKNEVGGICSLHGFASVKSGGLLVASTKSTPTLVLSLLLRPRGRKLVLRLSLRRRRITIKLSYCILYNNNQLQALYYYNIPSGLFVEAATRQLVRVLLTGLV